MPITRSVTASEARKNLSAILKDTTTETLITHRKKPLSVVVGIHAWCAIKVSLNRGYTT